MSMGIGGIGGLGASHGLRPPQVRSKPVMPSSHTVPTQRAPSPASAEAGRVGREEPAGRSDLFTEFRDLMRRSESTQQQFQVRQQQLDSEGQALLRRGVGADQPEYLEFRRRCESLQIERLTEGQKLQSEASQLHFRIELAAKVVEHVTQGVRNVSNTQM